MYVLSLRGGLVTDSPMTGQPLPLLGAAEPFARAPQQGNNLGFDDSV
jgi:hypothetical protein